MVKVTRKRYLRFEVYPKNAALKREDINRAIRDCAQLLFGVEGFSQLEMAMVKYFEERGVGVLRCSHQAVDRVRAALLFVREVSGQTLILTTTGVSGTIKSLMRGPSAERVF